MGLTFAKPRRRFFRVRTLLIVALVVAVGVGAYLFVSNRDSKPPLPHTEVNSFLDGWSNDDTVAMAADLDAPPADLRTLATSVVTSAPGSTAKYAPTGVVRNKTGDGATATYHARVDVRGFGPVEWDGSLNLIRVKVGGKTVWRIRWQPDVLYPGFEEGDHLVVREKWPARASIMGFDGTALAGNQETVLIGLEPDRVTTSLPGIKTKLQQLLGVTPQSVDAALHAPGVKPNYFVPVATVPRDDRYRSEIRPQLVDFPGLTFQLSSGVNATSSVLGPQVIGTVGPITADRLKQLGAPYRAGLDVGLTGLQATYEKRLAGKPSAEVVVVNGSDTVKSIKKFPGQAPQSVNLTIDPKVQAAAEGALAGLTQNAALVAVDTATGQLRAVVSKPDGGFNRALEGTYPPGSTFKVVTSAALLTNGSTGSTPAPCPPTIVINGRTFHNFVGEASGALDVAGAFKISCNNAFIGLGDKLPAGALDKAAASFGCNAKWSLPIKVAGCTMPPPKDSTEQAADSIGQGRVLASPAAMASIAAAVASGQWHAPSLTSQPPATGPKVAALDPNMLAQLRAFMASVPQSGGTAAGAGLPPGTFGKTGTAEFGNDNPPHTHAWFIGYRNNIAFALIVEDGGVGGRVAAPLAAKFLNSLPA
jgi:cell division protein FtsI/penicillin-binding protein 2